MPKKKDKVIIDTNLWISYLLSKKASGLDKLFLEQSLSIQFSEELLNEFLEVVKRPKLKKYFANSDIEELLFQINLHANFVTVSSSIKICRDPKDNFLLSLAVDSKASFLLTGDKDLLELKKIEKTQILTLPQFLSKKGIIR